MPLPASTVDLHAHSTASDGTLAPDALVAAAAAAGVRCFALTDHDTVDGLDAAAQAAQSHGLRLVPGLELSVNCAQKTLHVVGLGIDPACATLTDGLRQQQVRREHRAASIATKLEKLGVPGALDKAAALAGGGQITRTHFARLLVAEGRCKNLKEAFERYLGAGKPAYAGVEWAALDEAIRWIHAAGGRAVLAHPLHYKLSSGGRERVYAAFRDAGGDAIEVCSGNSSVADAARLADDARRHGLRASIGSDFHGPEQVWLGLGRLLPPPPDLEPVWHAPGWAD